MKSNKSKSAKSSKSGKVALATAGVLTGVGLGGLIWYLWSNRVPADLIAHQEKLDAEYHDMSYAKIDVWAQEAGLEPGGDYVFVDYENDRGVTTRAKLVAAVTESRSDDPFVHVIHDLDYFEADGGPDEERKFPEFEFRGNHRLFKDSRYKYFVFVPGSDPQQPNILMAVKASQDALK